ncbi:ABC transporter permease [soil metagenome]
MTTTTMTRRVLAVELRDELYAIIREPAAVFFSIALPVVFFALFASLLADESERSVSVATLMLATFGTFGVVGVALLNPGIGVAEDRERGWLRVKRVSPVPVTTTLAAKVVAGLPVAFGVFAAMSLTAVALGAFETDLVTWSKLAGILLVGSLPFALLGLAVGFMTSGRLAPVVLNAIFFTGAIAGGLWFPVEMMPTFVGYLAPWLPTYHLAQLGVGVLLGDPVTDHVVALLVTTVITAALASAAYRSART